MSQTINPTELAKKWNVSKTTVYAKMNSGELSFKKSGKTRTIDVSEAIRVFGDASIKRTVRTDGYVHERSNSSVNEQHEIEILKLKIQHLEDKNRILQDDLDRERKINDELRKANSKPLLLRWFGK